jgi:hypothetical protein
VNALHLEGWTVLETTGTQRTKFPEVPFSVFNGNAYWRLIIVSFDHGSGFIHPCHVGSPSRLAPLSNISMHFMTHSSRRRLFAMLWSGHFFFPSLKVSSQPSSSTQYR